MGFVLNRAHVPDIGRVVEVMRGRDAGLLVVVVAREPERFVWVADGDKRRAEKPKKKNVLHLRSTSVFAEDVVSDLERLGRITNARLRHTLKQAYMVLGKVQEELREGGMSHGQG